MISKKQASKLPKLSKAQQRALRAGSTDEDILYDTVDVTNTITHIMLGALIEPGRDREQWVRRQIRKMQAERIPKRYRTYEILLNAQLKPSAFDWLVYYLQKFEMTKAPDGRHLHNARLVTVDYEMQVVPNA